MEIGFEKKILDHGYIKLVGFMGSDESIIEAARMSTGKGFLGWDPHERCKTCNWTVGDLEGGCSIMGAHHIMVKIAGDANLLDFLYANRHMTPFEMGEICIEVKAPIFVFREWHRHRTQSYNEHSARYAMMPNEHYLPEIRRIQKQSQINKQSSGDSFSEEFAGDVLGRLMTEQEEVYRDYEEMVGNGVAKEVARINTPVSRYSKMRAKTDVRNWLAFLGLRMDKSAQWEIQQYALAMAEIIQGLFPRTYELFLEHEFLAVRLSRSEMRLLRMIIGGLAVAMSPEEQKGMEEAIDLIAKVSGMEGKRYEAFKSKILDDKEALYSTIHGASVQRSFTRTPT